MQRWPGSPSDTTQPCGLTRWALLRSQWGGQQTLGKWRGHLIFPACGEKGGEGGRLPCQAGSAEQVGWAALQGTSSPFPPAGSSDTWTGSPRGKRVMSSPSGNNRVFHGRTIAIKTACQGLACSSPRRGGPECGVERRAPGTGCPASITAGQGTAPGEPARLQVARALTRPFSEKSSMLSITSPGTPHLRPWPGRNPTVSTKLWMGFEQGCPIAQLQGVPPESHNAEVPELVPSG